MALTESTEYDKIEVVGSLKAVQVRKKNSVLKDGAVIASNFERYVLQAGTLKGGVKEDGTTPADDANDFVDNPLDKEPDGVTAIPDEIKNFIPVEQPLVRTIPMTKRKLLFLSSHIGKIRDWIRPDSMCFVDDLIEFSTKTEFVYSHRWNQNDLLMWDNRQTMHRVRAFDDTKQFRDMRRTTVLGEEQLI